MADDSNTKLGWRLLWAVVGAGLTFTVLSVASVQLSMPVMVGISLGAAVLCAILGPMILDLLTLVT
ncbi:MAG: hypothetical protein AAF799_36960 [Myxococcota bacterium]